MQIQSRAYAPLYPSPYPGAKQSPNRPSTQSVSQHETKNRKTSATSIDPSADPSADNTGQVTGKTAVQKTPEASNGQRIELHLKDQRIVQDLKKRDREVRAHEAAHLGAAGPYASGGPSYTYKRGPDGRQYAVGGEVKIDTAEVPNDPEATIRKAQVIRRAANAPAQPSAQDRRVAAQATAMEAEAQKELARERIEAQPERSASARTGESDEAARSESASSGPSHPSPYSLPEQETEAPRREGPHPLGGRLDLNA